MPRTKGSDRYWELWHQFRAASSANQEKIDTLVTDNERLRDVLAQIANGDRVTGEVNHRPRFGNPEGVPAPPAVRALRPYEIARRALERHP